MVKLLEDCKKWVILRIQESSRWQASPYLPNVTIKLVSKWVLKGFLSLLVLCYFFYKSCWAIIWTSPLIGIFVYFQWINWRKQVLWDIENAFKDWLFYVKGGLASGKSVEQAVLKSKDMFFAIISVNHPIRLGLDQVYRNLELHMPVEQCIYKMGKETCVESIEDFAVVFEISKKQGVHMMYTLEKTIQKIYERIELRLEIRSMIAAKKMEQKIMCIMPFGILFFVGNASGGYFEPLYHNNRGIMIMTVCMFIYLIGVWWGEKLTEVSV